MQQKKDSKTFDKALSIIRNNVEISPIKPGNTTLELGKYIYDGFQKISLSDANIVLEKDAEEKNINEDSLELLNFSTDMTDAGDGVYLQNIYETYTKLDTKIDLLLKRDYFDRSIIENALELICNKETERCRKMLIAELARRTPSYPLDKYHNIRESKGESLQKAFFSNWALFAKEMKQNCDDISKIENNLRRVIFDLQKKNHELRTSIDKQNTENTRINMEHRKQMNDLQDTQKGLVSIMENYLNSMENLLESDIPGKDLDGRMKTVTQLIVGKMQALGRAQNQLRDHKDASSEVQTLHKQVETVTKELVEIKEENVAYAEAIQKLNTRNEKLRGDCNTLIDQLRKLNDSNKNKKSVIEKQKRIIDILQSKIGDRNNIILFELQEKALKLKDMLEREVDETTRQKIITELVDYEKRIADFLSITPHN